MANSNMVSSLLKALDILNVVANSDNGIRLNELADGFDMKKTTVHNLVRTLRARNYLVKDNANRFHLGTAVQELLQLQHSHAIMRHAETILRELQQQWPTSTLTFSENCNGEIFCRLRMSADQPGFIQRPSAMSFPPYTSASSLALMAFNSDYGSSLAERFPFDVYALHRWSNRDTLEAELDGIRNRGFAMRIHEDDSCAIAMTAGERFTFGIHLRKNDADSAKEAGTLLKQVVARLNAVLE